MAATPKKYSYAEWAYFLKLLGEDESDTTFHKRPRPRTRNADAKGHDEMHPSVQQQKDFEDVGQEIGHTNAEDSMMEDKNEQVTKWSWIGNRSPLMGDKDEAEWLVEKLFQRLEESLRDMKREKERAVGEEVHQHQPSPSGSSPTPSETGESSRVT